jgi:hypothetical protein
VRDFGTSNLKFYSNETAVGSIFFLNLTVTNVEALYGWGIGLVYDNTTLRFMFAWFPTDDVFSGRHPFDPLYPFPRPEPVNATHSIVRWGASFIQGDDVWSFNGSGTMCQIQFRIIKEVNETNPEATSCLSFDPEWTTVYYWPTGQEVPTLKNGTFSYSMPVLTKLVGDVNKDGIVNMTDVDIVVEAFGSFKEGDKVHPRYNIDADLNGDGVIDMGDIIIVLVHFGQTV